MPLPPFRGSRFSTSLWKIAIALPDTTAGKPGTIAILIVVEIPLGWLPNPKVFCRFGYCRVQHREPSDSFFRCLQIPPRAETVEPPNEFRRTMEVMDVAQVVQVGRAKSVMRTKQLKGGMRGPPGAGGGSVASLRHMPTPSLSTLSSLTSSSPYPGVSPEDILRLEKAFSVEGLVRQIADIDRESE